MSTQSGRAMFDDKRTPPSQRPVDPEAVRRSRVSRGRARFAAKRGDRDARDALEVQTGGEEGTDVTPPDAAA